MKRRKFLSAVIAALVVPRSLWQGVQAESVAPNVYAWVGERGPRLLKPGSRGYSVTQPDWFTAIWQYRELSTFLNMPLADVVARVNEHEARALLTQITFKSTLGEV